MDVLLKLALEDPQSPWFDDVRTPDVEDRDAIIRRSFQQAVSQLEGNEGPWIASWRWGKRNQLVLPDLLGDPERAYNGGPVPGNRNTVCPGGEGGAVTAGAVYRMVIPLDNPAAARGASPGIQAGLPRGTNPDLVLERQLEAYLSGDYLPLYYHAFPGDFRSFQASQSFILNPRPVESSARR